MTYKFWNKGKWCPCSRYTGVVWWGEFRDSATLSSPQHQIKASTQLQTPATLPPWIGSLALTEYEAGWATEPVLKLLKRDKCLAHVGIRSPDLPARSLVIIQTTLSRFPVRSASVYFITFPSTTYTVLHPWLWHYSLYMENIVTATNIHLRLRLLIADLHN